MNRLPETGGLIRVFAECPGVGVDGREGTLSSMLDAMLVGPAGTLTVERTSCRSGLAFAFSFEGARALIVASESTRVVVVLGSETVEGTDGTAGGVAPTWAGATTEGWLSGDGFVTSEVWEELDLEEE